MKAQSYFELIIAVAKTSVNSIINKGELSRSLRPGRLKLYATARFKSVSS